MQLYPHMVELSEITNEKNNIEEKVSWTYCACVNDPKILVVHILSL